MPLVVASAPGGAYGLFFDTTAMARLDTARGSGGLTLRYEADVPSFDLYFLAGPRPADVLEAYAELTGFPALPPTLVARVPAVNPVFRQDGRHRRAWRRRSARSGCPATR